MIAGLAQRACRKVGRLGRPAAPWAPPARARRRWAQNPADRILESGLELSDVRCGSPIAKASGARARRVDRATRSRRILAPVRASGVLVQGRQRKPRSYGLTCFSPVAGQCTLLMFAMIYGASDAWGRYHALALQSRQKIPISPKQGIAGVSRFFQIFPNSITYPPRHHYSSITPAQLSPRNGVVQVLHCFIYFQFCVIFFKIFQDFFEFFQIPLLFHHATATPALPQHYLA